MNIHYLQHVPFEDIGSIDAWARKRKYTVTGTRFFEKAVLPAIETVDLLVVMGGPMNIYEDQEYPWLTQEKRYIEQAIKQNKYVLGICLGSQLISDVLGAKVYKNTHKEIGWFPVSMTPPAGKVLCVSGLPRQFIAFHWHGDTFDLPGGAILLASSQACVNQAYIYKERVLGLQFHLEITAEGVPRLLSNCSEEVKDGEYIQSKEEILKGVIDITTINTIMVSLLDGLLG